MTRHALDSGGFTELQNFGRWTITPAQYVSEVRRIRDEVGLLDWAAPMDWNCVRLHERVGVDLRAEPVVGIGSVCRRQATSEAAAIVTTLAAHGIRLHGFGFKTQGLGICGGSLASADSLAWSAYARRRAPMPGHPHKNCANCQPYALAWSTRVLNGLPPWQQPTLDAA
ncbi:hypothetical protein ACFO9E_27445 [Streptomyces maoxianensis]|uniref:DeoxyPurine in DNA protein A domain-containing protein n=1 Tax=Streptomyces maoxianensis TaxID=1459942 RepID=A0ABV9GBS8_9ACTN